MKARIKCRHCGRTNELPVREANGDTLLCDFCHRVLAGTGVAERSTKDIGRGERVRTTKDAGRTDFVEGAREKCRWGEEGVVLRRYTGHGTCYRVRHKDGSEATYDYDEVVRLSDEELLDVSYIKWRIEENIPHILWDEDRPRERIVAALRQVADELEKENA